LVRSFKKITGGIKQRAERIEEDMTLSIRDLPTSKPWVEQSPYKFSFETLPQVYRAIASVRVGRCDNGLYTPPFGINQIIRYRKISP